MVRDVLRVKLCDFDRTFDASQNQTLHCDVQMGYLCCVLT